MCGCVCMWCVCVCVCACVCAGEGEQLRISTPCFLDNKDRGTNAPCDSNWNVCGCFLCRELSRIPKAWAMSGAGTIQHQTNLFQVKQCQTASTSTQEQQGTQQLTISQTLESQERLHEMLSVCLCVCVTVCLCLLCMCRGSGFWKA